WVWRLPGFQAEKPPEVAELDLAGSEQGQARGLARDDLDGDTVEVGQPGHVVVRVALEDDPHATFVGLQHERARADHRLGAVEVPEPLLRLARSGPAGKRSRWP